MRADRLIAILLELQARGKTSSRKLAGKLEVSERTIHRDMEALSAAGIPVYALRGPDGGWELAEGYRTNLTAMQRTEILALIFATAISPAGTPEFHRDFEAAITRLLASMPPAYRQDAEMVRERIHIDGTTWHEHNADGQDLLPLLQEAVWSCSVLEILYRSGQQERARRRSVRPLGLVAKRQTWYLVASTRDGLRSFRVSRIQSAKATGKSFTRPKKFNLAAHWQEWLSEARNRMPEYKVRMLLRMQSHAQKYLQGMDYVRIEKQAPAKDFADWLEVRADFETPEWARFYFASAGDQVEVLEPKELRQELATFGAQLQKRYDANIRP